MKRGTTPGADAVASKGWLSAHKWLLLRRSSQMLILGLFLAGPLTGIWIVKGTLAASMTVGVWPLTDPFMVLQSLAAGHLPETTALVGAVIVIALYTLVGGRTYCSWVCPVNILTDAANWLAVKLGLAKGWRPARSARYWLLGVVLAAAAATGSIIWEFVNPITMVYRGAIFGIGLAWIIVLAVFLLDFLVGRRAWCGSLCPVGAFYGLVGSFSLLRVSARNAKACNACADCLAVCPESQVIKPLLKATALNANPVILAREYTNCGRCIDVCSKDVFVFSHRFDAQPGTSVRAKASLLQGSKDPQRAGGQPVLNSEG